MRILRRSELSVPRRRNVERESTVDEPLRLRDASFLVVLFPRGYREMVWKIGNVKPTVSDEYPRTVLAGAHAGIQINFTPMKYSYFAHRGV